MKVSKIKLVTNLKEVFTSGQEWRLAEGEHLPEDDPEAPHVGVDRVDVALQAFLQEIRQITSALEKLRSNGYNSHLVCKK